MQIGFSAQSKYAKGIEEGRDEDGPTANAKQPCDQARKHAGSCHGSDED
jgi:hypothetical protein